MDYDINNGRPDSRGTQSAELTIKAAKLDQDFASETSFTYTCSVKSGLYTNSPSSPQFEIVAEVLKLGNVMQNVLLDYLNFIKCLSKYRDQ